MLRNIYQANVCGKVEGRDDGVQTNIRMIECQTKDCTDLGDISTISRIGLELEEKVRRITIGFVTYYHETFWKTLSYVLV